MVQHLSKRDSVVTSGEHHLSIADCLHNRLGALARKRHRFFAKNVFTCGDGRFDLLSMLGVGGCQNQPINFRISENRAQIVT